MPESRSIFTLNTNSVRRTIPTPVIWIELSLPSAVHTSLHFIYSIKNQITKKLNTLTELLKLNQGRSKPPSSTPSGELPIT